MEQGHPRPDRKWHHGRLHHQEAQYPGVASFEDRRHQSPQQYLSWRIDLEGWAATQGIGRWIIGPLPTSPTIDPAKPELLDVCRDNVSQGMRYDCASIEDPNLRASMAIGTSEKSGPACLDWLSKEILQSQAEQPALQPRLTQ